MLGITDLIAGIFAPAAQLVDELHTSKEEKLEAKARLLEVQAAAMDSAYSYELKALQSRSDIINSEASSEHWLVAVWRPITMLTFLVLIVGDALALLPNPLSEQAWVALQLGLGGYVVSRSGEKIVKALKKG